ncbi:hypothetical protein M0P48_01625 [Candidatus Gracilibacteria bacterium]|jgi:hypothetical protein|nr:hypothetical protein [Candidatus Gracilibacteria bacterium]
MGLTLSDSNAENPEDIEIAALIKDLKSIPNPDRAIVKTIGAHAAISATGMISHLRGKDSIGLRYLAEVQEKGWEPSAI